MIFSILVSPTARTDEQYAADRWCDVADPEVEDHHHAEVDWIHSETCRVQIGSRIGVKIRIAGVASMKVPRMSSEMLMISSRNDAVIGQFQKHLTDHLRDLGIGHDPAHQTGDCDEEENDASRQKPYRSGSAAASWC